MDYVNTSISLIAFIATCIGSYYTYKAYKQSKLAQSTSEAASLQVSALSSEVLHIKQSWVGNITNINNTKAEFDAAVARWEKGIRMNIWTHRWDAKITWWNPESSIVYNVWLHTGNSDVKTL